MAIQLLLEYGELSEELRMRDCPGCLLFIIVIFNLMINLLQHQHTRTNQKLTLLHHVSIVWKLYVLHVVLLLHGANFLKLNPQQTSWISWIKCIQMQTHIQIMFALIRDVSCFIMQLQVVDGMGGRIQHDSLLIHIIISITAQQTISVESIVTQHHSMVLHQTWLLWNMITLEFHISNVHLTLR